ncbi:MerR family transcriptional regulator [Desulfosporosinus hippei]|uniref:MerR HTH family regulatory protein n=1 Tax=Desulfosporosinus hippei DSM 8344 TaxID=1121419 RepID=A0A1G8LPF3_9FIRM|nr:MerR family transcriptional regulator [Desulfosporosinus hippei]SDI57589.1 MerR HTH family regulatory protein [Desulfosporosinus hippei DSM 8344]
MYTFKQAAELAGLHENTARTYRDRFLEFFACTGEGRRRRYPEEAVAILKLISEKVSQNLTQEQIQVELERKYGLFINTKTPEHNNTTLEDNNNTTSQLEIIPTTRTQFLELVRSAVAQELQSRDDVIAELKAELEKSRKNFNDLMDKQESLIQERDERIIAQIRELMVEKQKNPWWQFWK